MPQNEITTADLLRMATDVVDGIRRSWPDERMSVIGREKVCTVITGYQDLVRSLTDTIEAMSTYLDAHGLIKQAIDNALAEARAAIPNEIFFRSKE